jgi:hypothetical protein
MSNPRLRIASAWCIALVACGGTVASPTPSTCPGSNALWVASDYTSSAVGALSVAGQVWATTGRVNLGADPALAVSNGRAFYVARDEDTIFALDARCGAPTQQWNVHQADHPGTSDPQDVGVASDGSLWIPLYEVPTLLVLSSDGAVVHTLDLSSYDTDGNPQAMGIAIVMTPAGEKAFVPLQRLNDLTYTSEQPSWMLRVDIATAKVEATIVLAGRNPFEMREEPETGVLWLADPGNFDDAVEPQAGVERFETATSTTALVAHEADLGGSVAEIAIEGACGAAIVADATAANGTSVVTFDSTSGAPIAPAAQSPLSTAGVGGGFDLEGSVWLDGTLFVGDRRRAANGYPVHALRASATCDLALQPDLIFLPQPPVAVRAPD